MNITFKHTRIGTRASLPAALFSLKQEPYLEGTTGGGTTGYGREDWVCVCPPRPHIGGCLVGFNNPFNYLYWFEHPSFSILLASPHFPLEAQHVLGVRLVFRATDCTSPLQSINRSVLLWSSPCFPLGTNNMVASLCSPSMFNWQMKAHLSSIRPELCLSQNRKGQPT